MHKLQPQEIEQIAMHYMKLNSVSGYSAEQLYSLYSSAVEAIKKIESETAQKHIAGSDWSL